MLNKAGMRASIRLNASGIPTAMADFFTVSLCELCTPKTKMIAAHICVMIPAAVDAIIYGLLYISVAIGFVADIVMFMGSITENNAMPRTPEKSSGIVLSAEAVIL